MGRVVAAAMVAGVAGGCLWIGEEAELDAGGEESVGSEGGDADGDGWSVEEGDCDDANPAVNPGAEESCETEWDDDCDGDTNDDGAVACTTYYVDRDGDGYGDPARSRCACAPAEGEVVEAGDCDDGDASTNPDAVEFCDDESDNNCDGSASPCDLAGEHLAGSADVVIAAPGDSTGTFGFSVAVIDANMDGYQDVAVGEGEGGQKVFIFEGPFLASSRRVAADRVLGPAGVTFGYALANAGDTDADGWDDLLVGEPDNDAYGSNIGAARVFASRSGAFSSATTTRYGWQPEGRCGTAVSGGGDNDRDGQGDFMLGCPGGSDYSTVHWYDGSLGRNATFTDKASTHAGCGKRVTGTGDVAGDGYDDIVVVCASIGPGVVYFVEGRGVYQGGGGVLPEGAGIPVASDATGGPIVGGQDLTGDGYPDAVYSAYDAEGVQFDAVVLAGGAGNPPLVEVARARSDDAGRVGSAAADLPGDLDGDGVSDLVLSVAGFTASCGDANGALTFLGPFAGSLTALDAVGSFVGCGDFEPTALAHADLDSDGDVDLVVPSQLGDAVNIFFSAGL